MTQASHDAARHSLEVLQDLLDGGLDAHVVPELRAHLAACPICAAEYDRLASGKAAAERMRGAPELPPGLAASLSDALDNEDASGSVGGRKPHIYSRRAFWMSGAAAAVVLLAALWRGVGRGRPDPVQSAADTYRSVVREGLPLSFATNRPADLEAHFAQVSAPRVRVLDLGMMGFTLEGGRAHSVGNAPSALYTYRNAAGGRLVCQMYEGAVEALPAADEVRRNESFQFHVFRRGAVTLVFWQEGPIVCALASERPSEEVVQLAMAKAMLPA